MNDDELEQQLHALPEPLLPTGWRATILQAARSKAPARQGKWISFFMGWHLLRDHRFSIGGLAAAWIVIILLKVATPSDPAAERLLAHSNSASPIPVMALHEERLLAEWLRDDDTGFAQPPPQP